MIWLTALALLCVYLETVLPIPDIAFALCVAVALKKGPVRGALLGGLCGALIDLMMGRFMGSNMFSMMAASLSVSLLAQNYLRPSGAVGVVCGLLSGLIRYSLQFLVLRTAGVNLVPEQAIQKIGSGTVWAGLLVSVWINVLSRQERSHGGMWLL